jgi:hypothetical protein
MAGSPAGQDAYCRARFLRCKKSNRVENGRARFIAIPRAPSQLRDPNALFSEKAKNPALDPERLSRGFGL